MTSDTSCLADLGWTTFFSAQLTAAESVSLTPARVMAVHRNRIHVVGSGIDNLVPPFIGDDETPATVGDWLLVDREGLRPRRLLRRLSVFKRRAAGTGRDIQLIAANVDTLFIVSSCNQDFNVPRLERYLALAAEAEVTPVVVLTKVDLAASPADFARTAARVRPGLLVETLDGREPDQVAVLTPWCGPGQTVALVGSSGVGKSTLVNTLTRGSIVTMAARADDDRGRHTTTGRALHRLPAGGWLLDTPGMRELQLTDAEAGIADVFADVMAAAQRCRFSDCHHDSEPGCGVMAAIETGALSPDRVKRWRKLVAEEAHNSATLAERRAREKSFGRMAKRAFAAKEARREDR